MQIKQLSKSFQNHIVYLTETLHDKSRGYGVVTIKINQLTFGIPLRTSIKHKNSFVTDKIFRNGAECSRGLDYQKAVLIRDISTDLSGSYKISASQRATINAAEGKILKSFNKYIKEYGRGVKNNDQRILRNYRYSTLQNYHVELALTEL
ncbi:MAG: protein AbiQ [Phenylobacterium sp.]|jgi:protein AbiQ